MTWALVAHALGPVLSASWSRVSAPTDESTASSGPAPSTAPRSSGNGSQPFDLTARAVRRCNRNPEATALYLAVHEALRRGLSK